MRLIAPAHSERRIHMNIVAREIQTNQSLEQDRPPRKRAREEDEQARGSAAIGDHVEDRAELGGLVEGTGGVAVEGVEEAGEGVEEGAGAWVEGHVVEGCYCEDYSCITYISHWSAITFLHI